MGGAHPTIPTQKQGRARCRTIYIRRHIIENFAYFSEIIYIMVWGFWCFRPLFLVFQAHHRLQAAELRQ